MMKIISWNQCYWLRSRFHEQAWEYLREMIAPDVALLQETRPPQLMDDEHIVFQPNHPAAVWGVAIYTRNIPISQIDMVHGSRYSHKVAAAALSLSSQCTLNVVSIHAPIIDSRVFPHLDHIFDEIETYLQGTTFIVGGDLNTARLAETVWPGYGHGPFFERISKSMFFDCVTKFHDHELQTYFRKGGKPWQDDHLFVSHDLADSVMSCDVINNETLQTFSDHIPLIAQLELANFFEHQ